MKCHNKPKKINCIITPQESKIFYDLQKLNGHEYSGALVFNKYGYLNKFNIFAGGDSVSTWGHHHIINFHTHPTRKEIKKYSPPSYIDYANKLAALAYFYKQYSLRGSSIVFDNNGCWVFTPTKKLIKEFINASSKRKKKILKILRFNTRILNLQLSQASHIIKCNKNSFPPISLRQYINRILHIMTPGIKSNLGYKINYYPKNKKIIIYNVHQCIEKPTSKYKVYNIPPKIERKFLSIKYKD